MKLKKILLIIACIVSVVACKKEKKAADLNETFDTSGATLLAQGSLAASAHSTSGTVKLYSKGSEKTLVFENFSTENGPDLDAYLSHSNTATAFVDLGKLKSQKGTFYYTFSGSTNTDSLNNVLIWCVQYSVLFGNGTLVK